MKDNRQILYSEEQRFNQPWLWALLIGVLIIVAGSAVLAFIKEHDTGGLFAIIIPLLIILLVSSLRLEINITREGIGYRFSPFHLRMQQLSWSEIESIYVRQYNPLSEYGGWGIRFGMGNGMAYNVKGNMGIQLVLTNGKKILIGTQHPEEVSAVLSALGR